MTNNRSCEGNRLLGIDWRAAMPVHIRVDGDLVILSNFGRLMNDPRHFDASQDVKAMLDQGFRKFAIELRGVVELGPSGVGLLVTITRLVRQYGGEAVLVSPSRSMEKIIDELQLDAFWEILGTVAEAKATLDRGSS
jgi:anti-anti-sigma factor